MSDEFRIAAVAYRALSEQYSVLQNYMFDLKSELAAAQADAEILKNEYICKCGLRVTPHRCKTEEEF